MDNKWQNLIKCNTESNAFVSGVLNTYSHQKFDPPYIKFYTLNIFRHLVYIQKGIGPLLKEMNNYPDLELPVGILLRSACLDILQYGFIHKCFDEIKINEKNPSDNVIPDHTQLKKELRKIFSGNIKNQIDDDKALKDTGEINDTELNERIEFYKRKFYWLLSEDNNFEDSYLARKIFRILKQNSKYDIYSNVFDNYSYYSKLEHLGILTWVYTTTSNYREIDVFKRLKSILITIIKVYQIGFAFLQREKSDIDKMDGLIDLLTGFKE